MRTDSLDYPLPPELIAQHPIEPRDAARLLVDHGPGAEPGHARVADLASMVRPGDLVVLNDTRVLPARLAVGRPGGGAGEVLLLEDVGAGWWEALCRPSRKLAPGTCVTSVGGHVAVEVGEDLGAGLRRVRPVACDGGDLLGALAADGAMPLPPYITETLADPERYQTVFARRPASAAAPTAGLHLSAAVIGAVEAAGATVAHVELVVGLDTFRPVSAERVEDHDIHSEAYSVPEATWEAVRDTRAAGGRVLAMGTTVVRALESVAATGELSGRTSLFIVPGHRFAAIDLLMTNFHLPRSSLLALVEAFVGPRWRELYATAAEQGYRFLSFGDAMLLSRAEPGGGGSA